MGELSFFLERLATPTGRMLLVTDSEETLRAAQWNEFEADLTAGLKRAFGQSPAPLRSRRTRSVARRAFEAYFDGDFEPMQSLTVNVAGTSFQQQVWQQLRRIPLGRTISYGTLAARIGRPAAVRAVGLANGANPTPVVVPCHRVIGANGTLVGFGGGLERKRWLLEHEGALQDSGQQLNLAMRV